MKILALTTIYPWPARPTMGSYNRQQFRALAAEHEVAVIAPVLWTDALKDRWAGRTYPRHYRNEDGIEVRHPIYYYPPKVLRHLYGECFLASVRAEFARMVREFEPDVVLGCYAHPDGWAAVRLAHEAGLPCVIKVVGTDVLVVSSNPRRRPHIAECLREADAVTAVSRDLVEHVVSLGADPAKVHLVHEGLDTRRFTPGDRGAARSRLGLPAEGRTVLFVGNILRSKGVAVLVEALALLIERGATYQCYVVGGGRDERVIRRLVAERRLESTVRLVGPRPHDELPDWYRASDVVALPSFSEGIPNVLREATACGRPWVATRVGGIPEIADGVGCRLVAPGSVVELADALEDLLTGGPNDGPSSPNLASWEESARRLAACLEHAVSSAAKPTGTPKPSPAPVSRPLHRSLTPPDVLRVLIITNIYPRPSSELVGVYNRQQFRALAAEHEVAVIAPVLWTDALKDRWAGRTYPRHYRNEDGIEVRHPIYYYPPKVLRHLYGECFLASVRAEFARMVREFEPDVVLGCYAHPDGWAAVRLAREAGLPCVVKTHGSAMLVGTKCPRRRRKLAEAMKGAAGVVNVSHDLAQRAIELGADPARVSVVLNGIDASLFSPGDEVEARARLGLPAGERIVLFVGNMLRSKGVLFLVEAMALLASRGVPARCYLVGQGRDEPAVRALIARHRLQETVSLVGPRRHAELPDWYRACDVVALPSLSEGIPNVLREASACGRPWVATRVGGIPEAAEPPAATLVAPGSASELADALEHVLKAPPRPPDGHGWLSWEDSARQLAECLREAVATACVGTRPDVALPVA